MDKQPDRHRKNIRLKDYDYSSAGYYFVTIVSNKRKNIFGNIIEGEIELNLLGMIVKKTWREIPQHFPYIEIDSYVVMPNHFHGIIIINEVGARHASPLQTKSYPLGVVVGSFKSAVTKRIHGMGLMDQKRIWQRNYYEHIIRDEDDYQQIVDYIASNPFNWENDHENPENL
ncbi:MAG: transposase [Chloroflexota bacterium]|nr:transposase [Chloroflexota bacterium]